MVFRWRFSKRIKGYIEAQPKDLIASLYMLMLYVLPTVMERCPYRRYVDTHARLPRKVVVDSICERGRLMRKSRLGKCKDVLWTQIHD